jgi:HEAT repeat protein
LNRFLLTLSLSFFALAANPALGAPQKPRVDKLLKGISLCEAVTLAKCPQLKKAVDMGPKQVPYLADRLAQGDSPSIRKSAAHVLQFFPQDKGLKTLAYQLSRERDRKVLAAIKQSLSVRGEAPVLRIARELLKSEDPGERVMAANLIGVLSLNGGGLELVAASKDPVPRVQYAAISAMANLPSNEDCKATLYGLLGSEETSWTLRHKAITAASDLNMKDAAPLIALSLGHEEEEEVRKAAARALGKFKAVWAAPALVAFLKNPELAGSAALALGEIGDVSSIESVVGAMNQPNLAFRAKIEVLWALGTLNAQSASPMLIAMLKDPNGDLVYHVANALGRIKSKAATLPLIMTMKHEKEQVRDIALWSLEQITGEKHGFDNEKWLTWYKATYPE